jgi:uncharacterized protein involved in type VI secretion and phage assembly
MFHVTGRTNVYRVRIGGLLEIAFHSKLKIEDRPDKMRVIRVKHVFDGNERYYNEFDAVSAEFGRIPCPDIDIPASALPARVVANEDPDGLGKVQVKFDFDEQDCEYWMPLMQPEAGKGDGLNRGYSFIPELDDMVLVSFFDGNPDFPFVMGSMFHGKNAANLGGGKGNHIKTITDKTGGQLLMNTNKQGEWSIKLYDSNGNVILLDTKGKNITITTPETMTLNAKNMKINVDETMDIVTKNSNTIVGENMDVKIAKVFSQESENAQEHVKKDKVVKIDKSFEHYSGKAEIQTTKGNMKIISSDMAIFQGKKDVQVSKG